MRFFSKEELYSLIVIFLLLVGISWPNFFLSLRRSRDQVRRDDVGNIQKAVSSFYDDYGMFPLSTADGKIIACKGPPNGVDKLGHQTYSLIPCNWGHDVWINLTPGIDKIYMNNIPGDPQSVKGVNYLYFSDGGKYQIFASLEDSNDVEFDGKVVERNLNCGSRICNLGRAYNVPLYISIEEYDMLIYCGAHPKDVRCIK